MGKFVPTDFVSNRQSRRAYILIVILGFAAVVTALGIAFLEANSTAIPQARNRLFASRSLYLAESGVNLAEHYLMYPPTTVTVGNYWTGANNVAVDAGSDYTDVSVIRDTTYNDQYAITAVGYSRDYDGTIRGKRSITARVIAPPPYKWDIPYGLVGRGALTVPATVRVFGDLHANGLVTGLLSAWCNGKVSSTGAAVWAGGGPPTSVVSNAPTFTTPAGIPSHYASYKVNGTTYMAYNYTSPNITAADAAALNAMNMSATNPGRIIVVQSQPTVKIKDSLTLNGTLVIQGDLGIDAPNVSLTAVPDYPALVVTGDIDFERDGATLNVTGALICNDEIQDKGHNNVRLNVLGAFVSRMGFDLEKSTGLYTFTWDSARSKFWRFDNPAKQPITVLSWKEE